MKYFIQYMFFISIVLLLFTACQPTPEKNAVAGKTDLESIIEEQTDPGIKYQYDKYWSEDIKTSVNSLSININCKVEVPINHGYRVERVVPVKFTEDQIHGFINYFAPDCKLYSEPFKQTKEQLEALLIEVSKGEKIDGKYIVTDTTKKNIEDLKEQITKAPSNIEKEYLDFDNINMNEDVAIGVELQDGADAYIEIKNMITSYNSDFLYSKGNLLQTEDMLKTYGETIEELTINEQDATEQAEKVIKDLDIKGLSLVKVQKGLLFDRFTTGIQNRGYCLKYMRENNGLKTIDIGDSAVIYRDNMPDYCAPWSQETVDIFIDKDGVQRFLWSGQSEEIETISDNVKLLSFEDIKNRIKKQLEYKYIWKDDNRATNINVENITMGLALINVKDKPGEGLLLPCWYIFYNEATELRNQNGTKSTKISEDALVLNAVDGSVIEPRLTSSLLEELDRGK
jgi:hypothetical protein